MAIKAEKKGDTLELEMSGVVGDGWSDTPITSRATAKVLRDNPDAKLIKIALNSPGGYVTEGLQIYQALSDHPARVEVTVGAQAASCGSLIAMAGDEITLHETSLFLVHNPWNLTIGDYQEHENSASELKMMADVFAGAYAKRSGMSKADVQKLMDEDRYMNADEAKKFGFCDRIIESKKKGKALSATEARALLDASRDHAMNRVRQVEAAALLMASNNETPAPSAPEAQENDKEMAQLAVILAALCLAEGTSDAEATAHINGLKASASGEAKLRESLGAKSTDEALGIVKALKDKGAQYDALIVENEKAEAKAKDDKKNALIAQASAPAKSKTPDPGNPHAGKLVPAQKAWAESVSLETLEGWLANAPVVLAGDGLARPQVKVLSYSGKPYGEMTNAEKHELSVSDPELFDQLREASKVS